MEAPNSALIAIDFWVFCMRHGHLEEAEPGYEDLIRLLEQKLI